MAQAFGEEQETSDWDEFASRHAGQPFLDHTSLYSLNESLIDAIQAEMPDFFTKEQEQFERDLSRTASFGFFCQRVLGFSKSDQTPVSLDERHARTDKAIKEMLKGEYMAAGASDAEIQDALDADKERREVINARKDAYVGWLVTNRQFKDEVRSLRTVWEDQICSLGRFPRFPHWPLYDHSLPAEVPDDCTADFLVFYSRWNLQQMLTWEWPVPMEPDLVGGVLMDNGLLAEAGVQVFLPWYVLRGGRLNLQEIIRHSRGTDTPPHLREWAQKTGKKRDELGDLRYGQLAILYRYLELVLRQRYPKACQGKKGKLDHAFSCFFGGDLESVRKLRQKLQGALR